jgi:hypothetical protein
MPFKFNPTTGQLDLVNATGGGTSGVTGPVTSTDKAITRWNGTTGNVVQDSKAILQDGGGIEAQGFITRKLITDNITIGNNEVMITDAISIETTGEIVIESDGELVIV